MGNFRLADVYEKRKNENKKGKIKKAIQEPFKPFTPIVDAFTGGKKLPPQTSQKQTYSLADTYEKKSLEKSIGLDTLEKDIRLGNAYLKQADEWQDNETMRYSLNYIKSVSQRINNYQKYRNTYNKDMPDLFEFSKNYNDVIKSLEDRSKIYSQYENADDYNNAIIKLEQERKEYEKKKATYLPGVQEEIDALQSALDTAYGYRNELETLKSQLSMASSRSVVALPDSAWDGYHKMEDELNKHLQSVGRESIEDLERALGLRKQYYNQAELIQNGIKLTSVNDENSKYYDPDYDKYVAKGKEIPYEEVGSSRRVASSGAGKARGMRRSKSDTRVAAEELYNYVNGLGRDDPLSYYDKGALFSLMTEDEFDNLAYYIAKDKEDGGNRTKEYVAFIKDELNIRRGEEIRKSVEGKTLSQLSFSIDAGLDQFYSGMQNLVNTKDDYIPPSAIQRASTGIRQDLIYQHGDKEIIGDLDWGDIATTVYDVGTTTSNMLPSMLVSSAVGVINPVAGAVAGNTLMGASASGNAYQEMLNLGYDKSAARLYSAEVGISEAALQYALGGIGKLGGVSGKLSNAVKGIDNGLAKFAIRFGGSIASEGLEEGLQEVLNPLFMNLAAGYDTGAEINWEEVAYSALLGGLSGGLFGGGEVVGSTINESRSKSIAANIKSNGRVSEVFDLASISPEASSAYDTYTWLAKKGINPENVSDYHLGLLATDIQSDAQAILDNKKSTPEQRTQAEKTIADLGVYAQANVGSRTGSASNINKKFFKDFDVRNIEMTDENGNVVKDENGNVKKVSQLDLLIEEGLESAKGTESYKIATELKAKVESGKKVSVDEIQKLYDANDQAIRAEEVKDIETKLVEKGETPEVANLVARKMRGETLTTEEAEKVLESDNALMVIAKTNNAENVTGELLETAKTMDKESGALFVAMYDGNTDIEAYANDFNLAYAKAKNNFTFEDISRSAKVLSGKQIANIFKEVTIKADHMQRAKFQKLVEKTANMKSYKAKIDDSIIDYNNTSAKGKINWNDSRITDRMRKAITFVKGFAQATGINLKLVADETMTHENGSFNITSNEITIDIFAGKNIDYAELLDTIIPTMSHEVTHWIEQNSPELYRKMSGIVFSTLQKKDGMTESERITQEINKQLVQEYRDKNPDTKLSDKGILKQISEDVRLKAYEDSERISVARSEIVARGCEDMLARSEVGREMFNSLTQKEQKTLVDKIKEIIQNLKDWVNEALGLYKDKATSEEARTLQEFDEELTKLSKLWDEALKESVAVNQAREKSGEFGRGTTEGKVLLQTRSINGNQVVWIEENILKENKGQPTHQFIANYIAEHIGEMYTIIESGQKVYIGEDLPNEYTQSQYTQNLLRRNPNIIKAKHKATANIREMIEIATNRKWEKTEHSTNKDAKYGIYKHTTRFGFPVQDANGNVVGANIYKAKLVIRNASDGKKYLYDIVSIKKDTASSEWMSNKISSTADSSAVQKNDVSKDSIPNPDGNVKKNFSKQDSTGKELSKGQMEYFKDSTVRDENGNLKVMYRGDSNDFTVFDRKKTNHSNLYGRGFYFTDSKAHAEQYGNAREFYLDIKNPLSPKQNAITKKQMLNFLKAIENNGEDYDLYNYGEGATAESVLNSVWGKGDFEMLQDVNASAIGDLVAAVELFNEVNGTNYDGIVLPTETVTFNSEQAKLASNLNPTKDKDIRFQMRENVEETRDLIAVHNMQVSELERTLDLGGLPMPSIAIIKAKNGHSEYGDVSLVFNKDTIDPKASSLNKVYGGDAWTPTYPTIEYKPNEKVSEKINKKYYELSRKFGYDESRPLYSYVYDLEEKLNRHKGEAGLLEELYDDEKMMQLYLLDSGKSKIETIQKEVRTELTDAEVEMHEFFINQLGADVVDEVMWDGNGTPMAYRKNYMSKYEDTIRETYKKLLSEVYQFTDEQVQNVLDSTKPADYLRFMRDAHKYRENGRVTTKTEADYEATKQAIKDAAREDYHKWVDSLFKGIEEKSGIRNNADPFTYSGNRRSWEALHWENNLENVVRVMKSQDNGQALFGGVGIWGVSAKEYSSISDIKADSSRLTKMNQEQYNIIKENFGERFQEIAVSIMDKTEKNQFIAIDNAMECIVDAIRVSKTKSGILNVLKQYKHLSVTDATVDDIVSLVTDISNMPTEYFEAKPKRAVELNEIATAIIPDNTSESTKSRLNNMGIKYLEYESGNEDARLKALNSLEKVRFQRREIVGESGTKYGMGVYLDDNLLTGLTDDERVQMVKEYVVSELAGQHFIAYDSNKDAVDIRIATKDEVFTNHNGKRRKVIKELYNKYKKIKVKQEAIVLIDELIESAEYDTSKPSNYSHDWLDDNGKNNWDYWKVFIQEKNKTVWEATLNIANSANGEKILYDINPIEMVEQAIKSATSTTNDIISQDLPKVNTKILKQDRQSTPIYDTMGETERVKKENEKLRADIERLMEMNTLEKKVTNGTLVSPTQVNAAAGHIRNKFNSNIDKIELMKKLKGYYTMVAESTEKSSDEILNQAFSIARDVVAEKKPEIIRDDYSTMIMKDIRKTRISLSETQKAEAQYRFGSNWNRNFFGRANITNDGIRLESQWQEWAEMYPDIFDANISESEMISKLYDILGDLKQASETVAEYNETELIRSVAIEVYNTYWNLSPIKTTADRYSEKIAKLKSEHKKAMRELRDDYNERAKKKADMQKLVDDMYYGRILKDKDKEVARQKIADDIHFGKIISKLKNKRENDVLQAKVHGKQMLDKYKDNAERKTYIQRITSNALSLNELLVKNSKDKHIPEVMKGTVIELLQAIDFSSKQMLEKGLPTRKDVSLIKALGHLKDMITDGSQEVGDLLDQMYGSGLDTLTKDLVKSVEISMSVINGETFTLSEMSADELRKLNEIVKIIKHSVNKLNQFHVAHYNAGVQALGMQSMEDIDSRAKIHEDGDKHFDKLKTKLYWNNLTPYYAFKNLGETPQLIFKALQDGQDKLAFLAKEVIDFTESVYTAKDYKKWSETFYNFEFLQPSGKTVKFKMNVPQIMSLYCVTKQEDGLRHILHGNENGEGGGITIVETKQTEAVRTNIRLTKEQLDSILAVLENKQYVGNAKEVADALQKFMGTRGAELGNEISMARWGIKSFGIENYFPIKVSDGSVPKKNETPGVDSTSMLALLNMSFTHARNQFANQSVEIGDMFDVFSHHMSDMIRYNSMALPILDMYKWLNVRGRDIDGNEFSIQTSIRNTFGDHAWAYFNTLLKDISGGTQRNTRDNLATKFFKNAKVAKVAGNIRVSVLQYTSFIRAGAVMDNKYLLGALAHRPKKDLAKKYCGIAVWKSMGYYDTDITRGLSDQIKHNENVKDKIVEWSLKGAEKADERTWGFLWNACELEIRDTRKDLRVGSQEFYEAISNRLRDVIYSTQVVDSMLTRSQMMRSPDGWDKMLTTFASESTLSFNLTTDIFVQTKLDARKMGIDAAFKKNGKYMRKAITAFVVTNMVTTIIQSLFDGFRDTEEDDKDEAYWRKLLWDNFKNNSSWLYKIPYINNFSSLWAGFSSSRLDTDWMQNAVKTLQQLSKLAEGKGDFGKLVKYFIRAGSDATGIPGYNVYRELMAFYDFISGGGNN